MDATDRRSAAKRGYGHKWQVYRDGYLRAHPLCVDCRRRGVLRPASVVDHIRKPRLADGGIDHALFWDPANHQALCKRCHDSYKQRLEKSGVVVGCDLDGRPIDPHHHWHAAAPDASKPAAGASARATSPDH